MFLSTQWGSVGSACVKRPAQPHSIQCGDESRAPQPAMAPAAPELQHASSRSRRRSVARHRRRSSRVGRHGCRCGDRTPRAAVRMPDAAAPTSASRDGTRLELDEVADETLRTLASAPAARLDAGTRKHDFAVSRMFERPARLRRRPLHSPPAQGVMPAGSLASG